MFFLEKKNGWNGIEIEIENENNGNAVLSSSSLPAFVRTLFLHLQYKPFISIIPI